ncbi:MAG: hypothetical protein HY343_01690, partial [Lentisphaerae bacterium]|nr:hypothetical protein [Lentisphaerota bacterium]
LFKAGAAQRVITPPVGLSMTGWSPRATGDTISRYVHDDLHVKVLAVERGKAAWLMVAADLTGIDAIATEQIRRGISGKTGVPPESILVCATHTHSGPAVATVVSLCHIPKHRFDGKNFPTVTSADVNVWWHDGINREWKDRFITLAIEAAVEAWNVRQPAEASFTDVEAEGLASSRRVWMSDGTWGDPRKLNAPGVQVVSRTTIDSRARMLWIRDQQTKAPLAAVINYGSHPWVFFGSGFSADLAGATAAAVAAAWKAPTAAPPVVLFTAGPEGDVTLIWNIEMDKLWRAQPDPGESEKDYIARREQVFDSELNRLSGLLTRRILTVLPASDRWQTDPILKADRQVVALPVKTRYRPPKEALLADWQKAAPPGRHLTEIQVLRIGDGAFVGLPGEPFASLGLAIRADSPLPHLMVLGLANEFGVLTYIGDRAAFALGGYEIELSPLAEGAGEILVEHAVALLRRTAGSE